MAKMEDKHPTNVWRLKSDETYSAVQRTDWSREKEILDQYPYTVKENLLSMEYGIAFIGLYTGKIESFKWFSTESSRDTEFARILEADGYTDYSL